MDTKYEKARIIGARALQISMGAPFMIKLGKKDLEDLKYNPVRIATLEYDKGLVPLVVVRPVPETRRKLKSKAEEKKA